MVLGRETAPRGRERVSWAQVLQLLVVNRLIAPGSEFHLHREWFDHSAMDVLLGADFAVAEKDRLYRCLDRVLKHKQALSSTCSNDGRTCSRLPSTCCSTT